MIEAGGGLEACVEFGGDDVAHGGEGEAAGIGIERAGFFVEGEVGGAALQVGKCGGEFFEEVRKFLGPGAVGGEGGGELKEGFPAGDDFGVPACGDGVGAEGVGDIVDWKR